MTPHIKSCTAYGIDKLITRTHFFLLLFAAILGLTTATAHAQSPGFSAPAPGSTLSGVVLIQGTATDADFLRYEIAFLREDNPGAGWIVFGEGNQPVIDGTLAVWDTTVGQSVNAPVFPDGRYQLRMRVVRFDSNYDEYFVGGLVLANNTTPVDPPTAVPTIALPTETPIPPTVAPPTSPPEAGNPTATPVDSASPAPTATPNWQATADAQASPTPVPTATPLVTRIAPTAIPVATLDPTIIAVPDILPTLTPFPTPPPLPTVEGQGFVLANAEGDPAEPAEIVENVVSFDYSQFGAAFSQGFRFVFLLFGLLALYLLLRNAIRWLWRLISSNW